LFHGIAWNSSTDIAYEEIKGEIREFFSKFNLCARGNSCIDESINKVGIRKALLRTILDAEKLEKQEERERKQKKDKEAKKTKKIHIIEIMKMRKKKKYSCLNS